MILSLHGKYEQAHISSFRFYYIMVYMVGVDSNAASARFSDYEIIGLIYLNYYGRIGVFKSWNQYAPCGLFLSYRKLR